MLAGAHHEGAQDCGHDPCTGQHQREYRLIRVPSDRSAGGASGSQCDGGDDRANVGLEQVCAHPGDVAHVVTDVIGDDSGVPRVVLGDARFDLSDQVAANIGGLGEDSSTNPGKQGDRASSKAEPGDHRDVLEDDVEDGHTQQADAHHGDSHDRTAGKCYPQRRV